ncbi:kinase-like domain-containing protein [Mycena olivaceomarginata]|nr:kinase-like domain-containing protein [Mycena olivaceomarginata]
MSDVDVDLDDWLLHNTAKEPAPTDIDTLLTIIESQSLADKYIGFWQWDDTDEKLLRETFISQDRAISLWINRYPDAWQECIHSLESRDWARLQALTHQTSRPRLTPTEYDTSIRFGAILLWTSSNSSPTSQQPNTSPTLNRFVADMVESMGNHLYQALPQRFVSCVFACLLQKFINDERLDDFRALMDGWKIWDLTTCLINFHSVLSTVLEFSKLIEDHELPKSLVDIVIHTDIHCICDQIDGLLRDPVTYQDFWKAQDDDAQQLLDLLQDLLDYPLLDSQIRPVIWNTLLKLSKRSSRHPRCFALPDLQLTGPVAGGGFADIWTSHFHNETVSVKVMRVFETVDIETLSNAFRKEAIIWRQLAHPNLLPFFGIFYLEINARRLCLVSPWMENGNIYKYLGSNPAPGINRLTLVLDVAIGLEHLHSLKLVHGDLKAMNVLVTRSGRAVLADFGLSSLVVDSKIVALSSTTHFGGTPEMAGTRTPPWKSKQRCVRRVRVCLCLLRVAEPAVMWHVFSGNLPQKLPSISDDVWPLMQECWGTEPEKRPIAKQIVARLSAPPISAAPTNAASDWEPSYTSKFRSSLQEHTLFHFMRQD